MKTMIKRTVMGTAIALAAMGANAADISLVDDNQSSIFAVQNGQDFNLTVVGAGFDDSVIAGSVRVSWDDLFFDLTSTRDEILTSATGNGWSDPFFATDLVIGANFVDFGTSFSDFFNGAGTEFTFFSLTFKALKPTAPSDPNVPISLGTAGNWQTLSAQLVPNYTGATVTVNEVPLPAAVWLFGTGLLGLAGIARRRNQPEAAAA